MGKKRKRSSALLSASSESEAASAPGEFLLAVAANAAAVNELLDARMNAEADVPTVFAHQAVIPSPSSSASIEAARLIAVRRLAEVFRMRCSAVRGTPHSIQ